MNSSRISIDSTESFFKQLDTIINEECKPKVAKNLIGFSRCFFDNYPLAELEGRELGDVFGMVYSSWLFLQKHKPKELSLRVFNPTLEEEGWLSPHTVIVVALHDMPFFVDSVRMALNSCGITLHAIKSTVLTLEFDQKDKLSTVLPANSGSPEQHHALLYLEVNRHTDTADFNVLSDAISLAMRDLDAVVADFQPMLKKIYSVASSLPDSGDIALTGAVKEAKEFLTWLGDSHFTFLGYSEYEFIEKDGVKALAEVPAARLGLMTLTGEPAAPVAQEKFNAGMSRFHLSTQVLSFTKSAVRSRVHRRAYSDYVVVKRFDAAGNVTGECRFLGLYTSDVYTISPAGIPVMREKMRYIMERSGLNPKGHDGKVLRQIIEHFPRDELLQGTTSELYEMIMGISRINERHQVRLFMRQDSYGKFVSFIIYIPREDFSTKLRVTIQELVGAALNSTEYEFNSYFSESILARTYLVFQVDPSNMPEIDLKRLEQKIVDISRSWETNLSQSLTEHFGEEKGAKFYKLYAGGFSASYQENFDARVAAHDIEIISGIDANNDIAMSFYQPPGSESSSMRFKIFHQQTPIELSDVIPVLEHMGLRVVGEHPYKIYTHGDGLIWLHDFDLEFDLDVSIDVHSARATFQEAFDAIWHKRAESDAFNRLILGARINWREVVVLRAYARYMKQTNFTFSLGYIASTLADHLEITRNLVALFKTTFDPRLNQFSDRDYERINRLKQKIIDSVDQVSNLNQDRILRRYLDFIVGTLRTNFFQRDSEGKSKSYVSFKFSPRSIADIPEPRPLYEIFVYSPRMEGVHLRGSKVARGGLRWSDRLQDYRTEVLGLVKAQQVKNAVIVPNGAKGGFVAKKLPSSKNRDAFMKEGIACYQTFIRGLLDLTDNIVAGEISPPPQVVRMDEDDPYLVVAADKGTASFSDIANAISLDYQHWLGDAFASGGSQGYDHKKMGITARGAWVSVQRHFKELGIDIQRENFSVIGIGDMGGDVFGNGMLLSEHIQLKAAFNHLHIFIDPNPAPDSTFIERQRLFDNQLGWGEFNRELISAGGGIFDRDAKSIAITPQMQEQFDIKATKLTPTELISALLKAPVDLIWNGGIGTYVKAAKESHADVGDKANDNLRVNANQLRCKVFGEGGNLGVTQLARIEYCLNGGQCNSDFIDNAAGVDCSDHEVNIKILIDNIVREGDLTSKQRNQLLVDMTADVAELVLYNNYKQTQVISLMQANAWQRGSEYRRLITSLENSGRLNRQLEFMPSDEELNERATQKKGLTRPELGILVSYIKVMLKEALATPELANDPYIAKSVETVFPPELRQRFLPQIYQHRLLPEIVATQIANDMVNHMGISFTHRLAESTGNTYVDIAKAYIIARDIFDLHGYFDEIESLDFKIDATLQFDLQQRMMRRIRRSSRWFLRNRRGNLQPSVEIEQFGPSAIALLNAMPEVMNGMVKEEWQEDYQHLLDKGVPDSLARLAALPIALYSTMGIVDASREVNAEPLKVAEVYFQLGEQLQLHWFAEQISDAKVESYWQAQAREAFMDDVEAQMRLLACSILRLGGDNPIDVIIERWMAQQSLLVTRWRSMITELQAATGTDFAMYSVALRELLDLAQASYHCHSLEDGSLVCDIEESAT